MAAKAPRQTAEQKANLKRIEFISQLKAAGVSSYSTREFSVIMDASPIPAPVSAPLESSETQVTPPSIPDVAPTEGSETPAEEPAQTESDTGADSDKIITDPSAFEDQEIDRAIHG